MKRPAVPTGTAGFQPAPIRREPAGNRRSQWRLNGAFFLVFAGGGAFQQFIGPYLLATYHLGLGASGVILATVYLVAFVCLTFTTYSLALLGEYLALVLGTVAYGQFGLVAVLTGNVAALILAAAVWGWGASVLWTAGATMTLNAVGDGRYGRASGALYTCVFVGQALGVFLLGALLGIVGARDMALCAVGVTLLGTLVALGFQRPQPRARRRPRLPNLARSRRRAVWERGRLARPVELGRARRPRSQGKARALPRLLNPLAVLATPTTRVAALLLLLSSSGFGLLLGVFGHIVGAIYGVAAVGWITASFYVARIPGGSGGGRLIDRLGRRPVLCAAFLASAATLLLAISLRQPAIFALCAALLGVQAAVVPVGLTSWVGDRATTEERSSTYAAIQLWSNVGTGLAILGGSRLLAALGGWQGSFAFFAALYLICATIASRLG